jgi:hypothetical protein
MPAVDYYGFPFRSDPSVGAIQYPDTTKPEAVSDLYVTLPCSDGGTISWTAPGDDGSSGTAAAYDLRYLTSNITEGNFASATPVSWTSPLSGGSSESGSVTGLQPCRKHYFALKTGDEVQNWSAISNVTFATTYCGGVEECEPSIRIDLGLPTQLEFAVPSPNPSRSAVRVQLGIPASMKDLPYDLGVYDVAGRLVRLLARGSATPGRAEISWDMTSGRGQRVEPGTYFARLRVGSATRTKTIVALP